MVITVGLEVVAEGECSANDESCAADKGIEPAEVLTECKDTEKECEYWAGLGEVSRYHLDWARFFSRIF